MTNVFTCNRHNLVSQQVKPSRPQINRRLAAGGLALTCVGSWPTYAPILACASLKMGHPLRGQALNHWDRVCAMLGHNNEQPTNLEDKPSSNLPQEAEDSHVSEDARRHSTQGRVNKSRTHFHIKPSEDIRRHSAQGRVN